MMRHVARCCDLDGSLITCDQNNLCTFEARLSVIAGLPQACIVRCWVLSKPSLAITCLYPSKQSSSRAYDHDHAYIVSFVCHTAPVANWAPGVMDCVTRVAVCTLLCREL
jgi:hypothetical protein